MLPSTDGLSVFFRFLGRGFLGCGRHLVADGLGGLPAGDVQVILDGEDLEPRPLEAARHRLPAAGDRRVGGGEQRPVPRDGVGHGAGGADRLAFANAIGIAKKEIHADVQGRIQQRVETLLVQQEAS